MPLWCQQGWCSLTGHVGLWLGARGVGGRWCSLPPTHITSNVCRRRSNMASCSAP